MDFQEHREIIKKLKRQITEPPSLDILQLLLSELQYTMQDNPDLGADERKYVFSYSGFIKRWSLQRLQQTLDPQWDKLYWDTMLFEARNRVVDSYLIYLEKNRDPEDKFYEPRRKQFLKMGFTQALQDLIDDEIDILSISTVPGSGKAQPLYSKVLTPDGFMRMGDVKIGQEVISGTGNVCKVVGVYPQGKKKVYEITFDDGTKVRCSDEHLWKVQTREDRNKKRYGENGRYRVIELRDMINNVYVEHGKRVNYSVDYVPKIDFKEKEFLISPYVLGALIGDGALSGGSINITNIDKEILNRIKDLLPDGYSLNLIDDISYRIVEGYSKRDSRGRYTKCHFRRELERLGLYGKTSDHKFIPEEYLTASYKQRLDLLRGLLDTDGCAQENHAEYYTVSEKLANDVVELVHSLGGYASKGTKKSCYLYKGEKREGKLCYRILIQFSSESEKIFSLERKKILYCPKRKKIKRFIRNIAYVGEEECQCIMVDDESHLYITDGYVITHNTTLGEMFMSGFMGWFPDLCNLFSSHSGHVTRMVYQVVCNIIGIGLKPGQIPEYTWREIFPDVEVESNNANEQEINLGKFKPFKTLTCRALGASQTGVTRCEGILYCDDLCSGIEMALSKIRLDKLWTMYSTDLKTRKKKGKRGRTCKELHIATRWSVWDVIGRIKTIYQNNKRCRFISVPDIDPATGESNFDYDYGVGFDVEYFEDIEKSLDDITYKCLYKNEPVEREGILYNPDMLRRYYGELPPKEPDAIWAFCDTKDTGSDYNCLGVFYQYGEDYYLHDVVFQSIDPYLLDDLNAECLVRNNVQIAVFESNKEGSRTGDKVQEKVKEKGGRASIEKRFTTTNKETKIIVNSPWVIQHVLFKHPDCYEVKSDYGQFMSWLCAYSQLAKNAHDDAPDMVAMLAVYRSGGGVASAKPMSRPF